MLPEAFLERMKAQLGAEYGDFLNSLERPRAVALRFNPLKGERPSLSLHSSTSRVEFTGSCSHRIRQKRYSLSKIFGVCIVISSCQV